MTTRKQLRRTGSTRRTASAWQRLKVNHNWLALWFMLPAAAFLILFLAYPLGLGVWLSFTDARLGRGRLCSSGLRTTGSFGAMTRSSGLRCSTRCSTPVVASTIKFAVGLYLALLLNENLPFKAIIRAVVLIPFIVPTVLSAIAFWWLFDRAVLDPVMVAAPSRARSPKTSIFSATHGTARWSA